MARILTNKEFAKVLTDFVEQEVSLYPEEDKGKARLIAWDAVNRMFGGIGLDLSEGETDAD